MCGYKSFADKPTIRLDISDEEPYLEVVMGDRLRRIITRLRCLRCGHEWWPRIAGLPVRCSSCRTPYWNIPPGRDGRTNEGKEVA